MNNDLGKGVYRSAYVEASMQLREILGAFEKLSVQKNQVEKLIESLKPELGIAEQSDAELQKPRKTNLAHCTVVTRLKLL